MSNKNFMAYGDAETILTEYANDIKGKEEKFRVTSLPTPSVTYENTTYQYIGTTTTVAPIYKHNYFYECKAQGTDPETYAWEETTVQSGVDSRIDNSVEKIAVEYDTTQNPRYVAYIEVDPVDVVNASGTFDADDLLYIKSLVDSGDVSQEEFIEIFNKGMGSFSSASLEDIAAVTNLYYSGDMSTEDISSAWKIGDTKTVDYNGNDVTLTILDYAHDTLTTAIGEETKACMTVGCRVGTGQFTATDGWHSSGSRTWCNSTALGYFDQDLQDIIKAVTRGTGRGSTTPASQKSDGTDLYGTIVSTSDKIFLPNLTEIMGANSPAAGSFKDPETGRSVDQITPSANTCSQYEYFKTVDNRKMANGIVTPTNIRYHLIGDVSSFQWRRNTAIGIVNASGSSVISAIGGTYGLYLVFNI